MIAMRKNIQFLFRSFQRRRVGILAHCGDLRRGGESGSALVETALILSFFVVPMLLGTVDMATLIYGSIEISNASHVGAMYGMVDKANAANFSTIIAVAQAEANDFASTKNRTTTSTVTVTPTSFYACSAALAPGSAQYANNGVADQPAQAAAAAVCPAGAANHYLEFIQVQVSAPVALPFYCCGLPASTTLSSTSVMEVE
jgi:Flp pilus assembly protein TadG